MAKNLRRQPAKVGKRETRCGNCPAERINIHLDVWRRKRGGNR